VTRERKREIKKRKGKKRLRLCPKSEDRLCVCQRIEERGEREEERREKRVGRYFSGAPLVILYTNQVLAEQGQEGKGARGEKKEEKCLLDDRLRFLHRLEPGKGGEQKNAKEKGGEGGGK